MIERELQIINRLGLHARAAARLVGVASNFSCEVFITCNGREINAKSPTGQRMVKFAFNLIDDGLVGQQVFAGEATRLAYMTDEAAEGRDAFLEKRDPDWSGFPWYY